MRGSMKPISGGGFKSQTIGGSTKKVESTIKPKAKQDDMSNILKPGESAVFRRPKTLVCYICGREYGTKSLPIHLKTCEQKWIIEQDQKPLKERKPVPQPPQGLLNLFDKDTVTHKDIANYNDQAFDQYNYENLEQCIICGRTFKPESLKIHQKSCKPGNPLKPLSKMQVQYQEQQSGQNLNLVPCRKCHRNFASDRISKHESVCKGETLSKKALKAQAVLEEKQKFYEKYDKIHKAPKNNWKSRHEELVQGMRYMRKVKAVQQQGGNIRDMPPPPQSKMYDDYVPCPYCTRKYSREVAERHIPKCQNIINKPKPPPSKNSYIQPNSYSNNNAQQQQQLHSQSYNYKDVKALKDYKPTSSTIGQSNKQPLNSKTSKYY